MLNGRIYRAAFLPLLLALAVAGFSLTGRAAPLSSTLAPNTFEGGRAFATLQGLARSFPHRRPGSAGDRGLAAYVAQTLRALGGAAKSGFAVSTHRLRAQTIDGERTLTTVIAQRPGTGGGAPIVILAHRDAAGRGARAELSGTAALLEIARVLAASETRRTIVLVSTSGGSGGNAGAADFAAHAGALVGKEGPGAEAAEPGKGEGEGGGGGVAGGGAGSESANTEGGMRPIDAALVLGDLAGTDAPAAGVSSFSATAGSAPAQLSSTVEAAIAGQSGGVGGGAGGDSDFLAQLAQLVFPLAGGEQGPLDAAGVPAASIGVSGEAAPGAGEAVSPARLEALGRAALAAVYALDGGPEIAGGPQTGLPIAHKTIPAWALRLLVAALLTPALVTLLDGLARMRRQRVPVGRWVGWTLACGLPFLACAVFAILLGALGAIPAPRPPVTAAALPFDGHALEGVAASALVLTLAWLAWPAAMRRLRLPVRGDGEAAALGMLIALAGCVVVVWIAAPLTALLLAPALHLWLLLAEPGMQSTGSRLTALPAAPLGAPARGGPGARGGRMAALGLVALGAAPLGLLIAFYAARLGLGPGGVAHTALLLLAGGRVGVAGALLWCAGAGCLTAALLLALGRRPRAAVPEEPPDSEWDGARGPITIRGPLSYAGPGSLGGTESALRR